jgi:hypothetical protein
MCIAGFLTRNICRNFSGYILKREMKVENQKIECAETISFGLNRAAGWRHKKAKQYSNDPRNHRAAELLLKLAGESSNLTEEEWARLQPYYDFSSQHWREAISRAARSIGFHHPENNFAGFIDSLVSVLSLPVAA